jgi:hypothetical protein
LPNVSSSTNQEAKKLIDRGVESKFVGYDERKGTYKFLTIGGKVLESKHAIFLKEKFTWSMTSSICETDLFQPGYYVLEGIDNYKPLDTPERQTTMSISILVNIVQTTNMVEPTTYVY